MTGDEPLDAATCRARLSSVRRDGFARSIVLAAIAVWMLAVEIGVGRTWAIVAWAVYLLFIPLWIAATRRELREDARACGAGEKSARERYRVVAFTLSVGKQFAAWLVVAAALSFIGVANIARGDPPEQSTGLLVLAAFLALDAVRSRFVVRPRIARDLEALGGPPRMSSDVEGRVREAFSRGGKIEAIKAYRDATGAALGESVLLVEAFIAREKSK